MQIEDFASEEKIQAQIFSTPNKEDQKNMPADDKKLSVGIAFWNSLRVWLVGFNIIASIWCLPVLVLPFVKGTSSWTQYFLLELFIPSLGAYFVVLTFCFVPALYKNPLSLLKHISRYRYVTFLWLLAGVGTILSLSLLRDMHGRHLISASYPVMQMGLLLSLPYVFLSVVCLVSCLLARSSTPTPPVAWALLVSGAWVPVPYAALIWLWYYGGWDTFVGLEPHPPDLGQGLGISIGLTLVLAEPILTLLGLVVGSCIGWRSQQHPTKTTFALFGGTAVLFSLLLSAAWSG